MTDETQGEAESFVDEAIEEGDRKRTIADRIIELAASATLFRTPDGAAFADVIVGTPPHRETWAIRSRGFRSWLIKTFYDATAKAPNADALQQAIAVLEARAAYDAPELQVFMRLGSYGGKIYLDLADREWQAVEVDTDGWRAVKDAPVRFRRTLGMLPLPMPIRGGSVSLLRPFLNLRRAEDWRLVLAWLHAALRDRGPYPPLMVEGEQGAAKSTMCKLLRNLIDPNTADARPLPREDRDLYVSARNAHVLSFDNASGLAPWVSDTLCRLSTGGGFAVRALYTDDSEMLFSGMRPILLNGIENVVGRPDLADRSLFLALQPIPDVARRIERELWSEFEAVRPAILGALLDDLARGLRRLPTVKLATLPRMADFALWATACESIPGAFEKAFAANRKAAVDDVLALDVVATALRDMLGNIVEPEWRGTATRLLQDLTGRVSEKVSKSKEWPVDGTRLSGRLTRLAPDLRKVGIVIERLKDGQRTIVLRRSENAGKTASVASAASKTRDSSDLGTDATPDASVDGDGLSVRRSPSVSPSVSRKPLESNGFDGTDAADVESRLFLESDTRPRPKRRDRKPETSDQPKADLDAPDASAAGRSVWRPRRPKRRFSYQ